MPIVSIHQPNFLPWLGFFNKIASSDVFVLLDNVQFVKGHICNRNKIKNNQGKAVWITVPVSQKKGTTINFNELGIDYNQKWGNKILNQLRGSYGAAPNFKKYMGDLEELLISKTYTSLADLNISLIRYCCAQLNIDTRIEIASEQNIDFGSQNEQNLNICLHFGGDTYLSGEGAKKYNDENLFTGAGVSLIYQDFDHPVYSQLYNEFVPNLSVIDLLMNEGVESGRFFKID